MRQDAVQRFNNLSLSDKCTLVTNYGKWLWWVSTEGFRISVFELEGEIVEVWYNITSRTIRGIRIPSYKDLDIHISHISLPIFETN